MSYPILNLGQDHPFFRGVGQGVHLVNEGIEAMYKPQTLSEKLKTARLYNKYYGQDMESQIGNRNAQTDYTKTQNQWFGPTAQSNIDWIYKGQIPQAIAHAGQLNAQSSGQRLENNFFRNTFGGDNDNTINPSPNYSAPDNVRLTGNRYNPYPESYNPTTVQDIPATGPIAPLNNADKQAMQQNKIQQQAFDYLTKNNVEATGANIDKAMKIVASQQLAPDTYAQAQQNNAPMQSANPASVTEYIKNLGGITGQQGGMSMAPQQRQPFVPSSQNLSSLRQGDQQAAQMPEQTPAQTPAQNSPMSLTDKMQKYRDFQAAKKGLPLPSMEAENAANKEIAVLNAKKYVDTTDQYSKNAEFATKSLRNLDQLESSFNKLNNMSMSSIIPEDIKKKFGSPEIQSAIKEANQLMLGQLKPVYGGMGQLRNLEMQKLMESLPNINMTKEAGLKVIKQLRLEYRTAQAQGALSSAISKFTKDPNELRDVLSMAAKVYSPVDETGQHPERVNKWKDFANREALNAIRNNTIYIPSNAKPKDISPEIRRELIASMA